MYETEFLTCKYVDRLCFPNKIIPQHPPTPHHPFKLNGRLLSIGFKNVAFTSQCTQTFAKTTSNTNALNTYCIQYRKFNCTLLNNYILNVCMNTCIRMFISRMFVYFPNVYFPNVYFPNIY